jgi:hypothetical protein
MFSLVTHLRSDEVPDIRLLDSELFSRHFLGFPSCGSKCRGSRDAGELTNNPLIGCNDLAVSPASLRGCIARVDLQIPSMLPASSSCLKLKRSCLGVLMRGSGEGQIWF